MKMFFNDIITQYNNNYKATAASTCKNKAIFIVHLVIGCELYSIANADQLRLCIHTYYTDYFFHKKFNCVNHLRTLYEDTSAISNLIQTNILLFYLMRNC